MEISQWAPGWCSWQCTWLFIFLKAEMARYVIIYQFMHLIIWLEGQGLGRNKTGKSITGNLEKRHEDRPLNEQEMRIYLCPNWMFTKGWPSREGIFKNRLDRVTYSGGISPFSQAALLYLVGSWIKWTQWQWWRLCLD